MIKWLFQLNKVLLNYFLFKLEFERHLMIRWLDDFINTEGYEKGNSLV